MTQDDYYARDAGMRNYWCPNVRDTLDGKAHRDHTLSKWAAHLQNDFRTRMDWCVTGFGDANHPPVVSIGGPPHGTASAGEAIELDASQSTDPDGHELDVEWLFYPEPSGYAGPPPVIADPWTARTSVTIPAVAAGQELHYVAIVTDSGEPPLTRYRRVVVDVAE
jgi:hypothetical protein